MEFKEFPKGDKFYPVPKNKQHLAESWLNQKTLNLVKKVNMLPEPQGNILYNVRVSHFNYYLSSTKLYSDNPDYPWFNLSFVVSLLTEGQQ